MISKSNLCVNVIECCALLCYNMQGIVFMQLLR